MLRQSKRFLDTAKQTGIKHIVHIGASTAPTNAVAHWGGHQYIEAYIEKLGFSYTHLRPGVFIPMLICIVSIADILPAPAYVVADGALVALFAGFVRGFAGFGFSAFTVAGLSLLTSPTHIVPASMLLEVLASLSLLHSIWQDISWKWLTPLVLGNAIRRSLALRDRSSFGCFVAGNTSRSTTEDYGFNGHFMCCWIIGTLSKSR